MSDDIDDDLQAFALEDPNKPKLDPWFDPAYPDIKEGAKFTPKKRGDEYYVYTVVDAHPSVSGTIEVEAVMYDWCGGYYMRANKQPFNWAVGRDEMLRTHSLACQGKKK